VGIEPRAGADIASALTVILADMFALYIKTKNFHWHVSGPHFRDYHLLLDEQSEQIFAATDAIAERVRKIGGTTLRSIGHIARLQRVADNDEGMCRPRTCLRSFWKIIGNWLSISEGHTRFVMRAAMSPGRA